MKTTASNRGTADFNPLRGYDRYLSGLKTAVQGAFWNLVPWGKISTFGWLFTLALFCFSSQTRPDDWPRFLGSQATGKSGETNLLETWPKSGPPLLWEKEIGAGYSAPSIQDNQLVLHHRLGNEEIIECFEAPTGKPLWRYAYPSLFRDPYGYNNGPRATPLLKDGGCYTFGAEGRLVALDLKSGKLRWERKTGQEFEIPPAFFGVGSSPILEANFLIAMVGGQTNAGMVAFDPQTGKTVWENVGKKNWEGVPLTGWRDDLKLVWKDYDKQASYATPVAATIQGKRRLFCLMRQGLVMLNPTNGAVSDSFFFRSTLEDSVNAANPVIVGNEVLISGAYGRVGAVLLRVTERDTLEEVWRSPVLEIHWTTPIYHDGFLYAFSGRNEPDASFRCVEMKSGKLMWERNEAWRAYSTKTPDKYGRGSAILADGKLITLGEGGILGIFKVDAKTPREISRWQVPQLHYPCWAAPVLSNGKLYLRSEDRLVCLNLAK